ncbi:MAG: FadR/GntR family transcriptional regulator [Actinomycetota bacterium]
MGSAATQRTARDAAAPAHGRQPNRLHGALFQPIGDEGRAELVERRLVDAITRGHLRAGERLPAETELARSLGVAPVTVREALLALRSRGLVTTKRGRNGGSFVADHADPLTFTLDSVRASSRLALRDLGAHYAAITAACVRLAARRADPSETARVRLRMERGADLDFDQRGRLLDDVQIELAALSQSARLTREQMRLQAEVSPYLRLVAQPDRGERQSAHLTAMIDAVEAGDETRAALATEVLVTDVVEALIALQSHSD